MDLVDTHCHIHFESYPLNPDRAIEDAQKAGVKRMICVGTTVEDSKRAIDFAAGRENIWATAGVHPHGASEFINSLSQQESFKKVLDMSSTFQPHNKPAQHQNPSEAVGNRIAEHRVFGAGPSIFAVGEIGLDYFKNYSAKADQQKTLRFLIEASLEHNLPYIFHVRDAWEDFWGIFDSYPNLQGVVHSFSAHRQQLDQALERGLFIGLNGIMTFTNDEGQLEAAKTVPLDRLVLETDAPFLAPKPERGKTCEPRHTAVIAEFLAELRNETLGQLSTVTTRNAINLFKLS